MFIRKTTLTVPVRPTHVVFIVALIVLAYASGALGVAPASAQARPEAFWICNVPNAGITYYSDVLQYPDTGDAYTTLVKAFQKFAVAKYNLSQYGTPVCIHYAANAEARARAALEQFASKGAKAVLTGWKGDAAGTGAPANAPAPPTPHPSTTPAPVPAPAQGAPSAAPQSAASASTSVTLRLVDQVHSATDPPGKKYRAVVTKAVTAGGVTISQDALGSVTISQTQSGWTTQLSSLTISGVARPVTSSSVTTTNPVNEATKQMGSVLSGFGRGRGATQTQAEISAAGSHVVLPPGTLLTFAVTIPPAAAPTQSNAPAAAPAAPAPAMASGSSGAAVASPAGRSNQSSASLPAGTKVASCFGRANKFYYSGFFDGTKENTDKTLWTIAFTNYLAAKYEPAEVYCTTYGSLAQAQHAHDVATQQQNPSKVVETEWVYKGAEPGPSAGPAGMFGLCFSDPGQSPVYYSGDLHVDFEPVRQNDKVALDQRVVDLSNRSQQQFLAFLQKTYGYKNPGSYPTTCQFAMKDRSEISALKDRLKGRFPQAKFVETGWLPGTDNSAAAPAQKPAPAAPTPQASIAGTYTGSYICGGRTRSLTLAISGPENGLVTVHFTAYQPPESHDKPYTFVANGQFDPATGKFKVMPLKWETPAPPNIVMVGLTGTFDAKTNRVTGTIDFSGCTTFEARRGGNDH